ncbi:electron transfer flavoprotein subunit alpha/FixB family protein [Desulfatitalea tepidiphila]|uniref:electron transfer flavoprotein subunit alpha/FixB family protein n=1 Tax=Desulfatitalea tepidiphila TaxID=1185843 RepID=UPI0006B575CA|nr:electron transfer flavoprotein subunit alpha/FixB family protein [Desulfatitalea tepidiphila]
MTQHVLVIAEQVEGVFRKVTFEVLSAGRRLAGQLGGSVQAVVLGSGIEGLAAELGKYGAEKVFVADDPALADFTTEAYTNALAGLVGQIQPAVILLGATTQGKDLGARLSARLNAALATDAVGLGVDGGQVVATRPMYGGKVLADVVLTGAPAIVSVRPNTQAVESAAGAGAVEKAAVTLGDLRSKVVGKQFESGKVDLTEADAVVTGGRGMGGADYSAVEALAGVLGAAVGASRSAVDEGWRPASDQVGQTGKTVSPNLYVACGVSGAIQHLAGMSSSKVIVAINKDPEAPIIAKADYAIVGDLFEVLPALTEEIKKIKG